MEVHEKTARTPLSPAVQITHLNILFKSPLTFKKKDKKTCLKWAYNHG